jgi:quercetin dioxygenase-like cupin family protein
VIKSYIFSDSEKVPWRESNFAQGVQVKDLGVSDGQAMQLVKFAAGAQFPWHKHTGPEFIYVFSGEVIQRGRRLSAGWAGVAPAGTEEDDFASETGAIFLIVYTE